eukprot:TRINITY_DN75846_c0_g1_i1.p1 TRINITY_DN75846_c0_g1~~TRINITY_DN75846_c0_g1_i1.p1  ORF type:complete len:792 (+),score=141.98 TRINITY_DN75846_c0_g1_i1:93-2378(+)
MFAVLLRVAAMWLVPLCSLFAGSSPTRGVLIISALATLLEVSLTFNPFGNRKRKVEKRRPVIIVIVQVIFVYGLQVWWMALDRATMLSGVQNHEPKGVHGFALQKNIVPVAGGMEKPQERQQVFADDVFYVDAPLSVLAWDPKTISVVLPCAEEREYAFKTVKAVFDSTPASVLHEIIVVDDGSEPPLSQTVLGSEVRTKYNVKIERHAQTVGLIGAKKTGGDAATGDIVVFFDCHVAPQPNWYQPFLSMIAENYRRMVVPQITALDVTTWTQIGSGGGMAKCYLTWDADFKWFDSNDPYIAVISGGLLGMSKRWFTETGGFDKEMLGWGGENLDQSLRVWQCGGEILNAGDSQVAHMWRSDDQRTAVRYKRVGSPSRNRARAVYGWFGEFAKKLDDYPSFASHSQQGGEPWYGKLDEFENVKKRLGGCRSFAWFLRRFRSLYEQGGLLPLEIFMIKLDGTSLCLKYMGAAGTSGDGKGSVQLADCNARNDRFYWHRGNKGRDGSCCGGLRAWNTDQCFDRPSGNKISTYICDVAGNTESQTWSVEDDGRLTHQQKCVVLHRPSKKTFTEMFLKDIQRLAYKSVTCSVALRGLGGEESKWVKVNARMPLETQLYQKAQREKPESFGDMGVQPVAFERPPLPESCDGLSCLILSMTDDKGIFRCLDEHGLMTTAKQFCWPYSIDGEQISRPAWMGEAAKGQCLDSWNDNDPLTWSFFSCHKGTTQRFERVGVTEGDASLPQRVCVKPKQKQECFEVSRFSLT